MEIAVFGERTFMQNMWSGVVGDFQGDEEARLSETAWRVFSVGSEEFGYEDGIYSYVFLFFFLFLFFEPVLERGNILPHH
jgi:hypothetical protein